MNHNTVVILGGGVGGLVAANELRRRLGGEDRIVLVERNPEHAFAPSFPWLMIGERQARQITRPLAGLVRPGVEVLSTEIRGLDLANRQVVTDSQTLTYDYLIIALGAELAPEAIPGLPEAMHTFYTLEGAAKLREALPSFAGGTVAVVVAAMPYKCPGAPHEGAMLLGDYFRRRGIRDKVDLHLYTPEPQPMPVAGPQLGEAVRQMLAARDIAFHPQHKLTSVEPGTRQLAFEGKPPVSYDLLVAIPPHRPPALVRAAGLANEAGWLPVDRATLGTGQERVYALGDVTALSVPGRWKPDVPLALPKAGVFAHAEALVVAQRIAAERRGVTPTATFDGEGFCALEAGAGRAGFAFGNFFAEPSPEIHLGQIDRLWHLGKVLFEQWWLTSPGTRRQTLRLRLALAAKARGIPVIL